MEVTRSPQALRMSPILLAVTPFPSPLTTPPVTKTYFISIFTVTSLKNKQPLFFNPLKNNNNNKKSIPSPKKMPTLCVTHTFYALLCIFIHKQQRLKKKKKKNTSVKTQTWQYSCTKNDTQLYLVTRIVLVLQPYPLYK